MVEYCYESADLYFGKQEANRVVEVPKRVVQVDSMKQLDLLCRLHKIAYLGSDELVVTRRLFS